MKLIKFALGQHFKWFAPMSGGLLLLCLCSIDSMAAWSQLGAKPAIRAIADSEQTTVAQNPNLGTAFKELGVDGSIIIYDKKNDLLYEHNPARNTTPFFPASTFKILNALISLETGVIRDDLAVLTWDGIQRDIPAWNRDTNLRQAFKDSTVWFGVVA